jgi:hypothetical protein
MAAADITTNKDYNLKLDNVFHSPIEIVGKLVDGNRVADLWTVANHKLINVPVGKMLESFTVIVTETFTSGGAPTMRFRHGSAGDTYTGAIPLAQLAKGKVFKAGTLAVAGTAPFSDGWAHTAAWDLSIDVAVAAYTAGAFIIYANLINVQSTLDQYNL